MQSNSMQPMENNAAALQNSGNIPAEAPALNEAQAYGAVYPELYMKLKPHIDMACDILNTYGATMPTQHQLEQVADGVLNEFCALYPEMSDYMHRDDPPEDVPVFYGMPGGRPGFPRRPRFRRRGIGRDLIATLLLAELFDRGFNYY